MNLNEYVLANHQTALELLRTLCLIPSPSHHEEKRAAFCKAWLMDHGAENAFIDEAKNVIYEYNAENDVPVAIFMAHIDTVFPESVPLELTEKDGKWFCPAVGDDTANVALLMLMAAYVANEKPKTNGGVVFVMNSCEEGLGNLKGSRALNARYGKRIEQVISFDGYLDGIVGMAVGSLRYKVTVKTAGGHSFVDFGNVNAIERLSAIITELYQYKIPAGSAKTTFNVGTISGGTTVNSIAAQAEMLYEMRSDDYACLMDAKAYFEKILEEFKAEGVDVTAELLGERPCGNKENHDPRQTALLTQMYRIVASLSGEFYSDLFLDRFRFASGNGRTWKKNGKRSALWCIVAWNFKLLLWRCTVCDRNVPIYSGNFCENGGISDPVDAFVSVYGNRPK